MMIKSDDVDVRKIAEKEVQKYRRKVITCACLYLPLLFCIWGIPFIPGLDDLLIIFKLWNGNTCYVLFCLGFASLI